MRTVWKLIAFNIMINIAIAIIMVTIPQVFINNPVNNAGITTLENATTNFDTFGNGMGSIITPDSSLQNSQSLTDRVLDLVSVGIIEKFKNSVNKYVYGWIDLLDKTLGIYMEPTPPNSQYNLRTLLFGGGLNPGLFKSLLTFAFIIGLINVWTGRELDR